MRYYSEKDIDFTTEYINYNQFLLQEFFNADAKTWMEICTYYRTKHGNRSLSYLTRKFNDWKKGNYHLTDLMESRILDTIPMFLSEEAKQKLSVNDFLSLIKRAIKSFESKQKVRKYKFIDLTRPDSIIEMFRVEVRAIKKLEIGNTRFGLLTEAEKNEAKRIVKYILKIKLHKFYTQFKNDLNVILPFLGRVTRGIVIISYSLRGVNLQFNFQNTHILSIQLPEFEIQNLHSESQFNEYASKYLAYELSTMNESSMNAKSDGIINQIDLDIFFSQYEKLIYGDNEVKMTSHFRGEAGDLKINANIIPVKLLKLAIYKSIFKILITLIILIGVINWIIKDYSLILLAELWFISLPVSIFTISFVRKEFKKILQHKKEI